jgi:hypothetical protein
MGHPSFKASTVASVLRKPNILDVFQTRVAYCTLSGLPEHKSLASVFLEDSLVFKDKTRMFKYRPFPTEKRIYQEAAQRCKP